jgi:hypothetical protein
MFIVGLAIAGMFGYETPRERQEKRELRTFMLVHQRTFCRRERIPDSYCDQIWHDSAAQHAAVVQWVGVKMDRDNQSVTRNGRYWNPFSVFTAPFQYDDDKSTPPLAPWEDIPSAPWEDVPSRTTPNHQKLR